MRQIYLNSTRADIFQMIITMQIRYLFLCLVFEMEYLQLQFFLKEGLHFCGSTIASQGHPEEPWTDLLFQILQVLDNVSLHCSCK